ncbi:uncharacterized protein LOC142488469 [Ascaphus truei]|uniref:uncharacterized protein LOC142488469 n=1 Tax=Ascaphus truei TaxID=8439 RepID=UPI003F5A8FA6
MRLQDCALFTGLLHAVTQAHAYFSCPNSNQDVKVRSHPGASVYLPCTFSWHGEPPSDHKVVWQKKQGKDQDDLVVHYQNGEDDDDGKSDQFHGRTEVSQDWFHIRNATLQLHRVSVQDTGLYKCFVAQIPVGPEGGQLCCEVTLTVDTETKATQHNGGTKGYQSHVRNNLPNKNKQAHRNTEGWKESSTYTFLITGGFIVIAVVVFFYVKDGKKCMKNIRELLSVAWTRSNRFGLNLLLQELAKDRRLKTDTA